MFCSCSTALSGRESVGGAASAPRTNWTRSYIRSKRAPLMLVAMELHLFSTACLLLGSAQITQQTQTHRPQMFPCLTYLERNVRVDCEFPPTYQIPGPYCEYRQDSRLVGTTVPNQVIYVNIEDRRRSNVSLVYPNLCRLTWAPLADETPKTYTCRVYQGNSWKENSMAVHHRILPICSALSVKSPPWLILLVLSLPLLIGLLNK